MKRGNDKDGQGVGVGYYTRLADCIPFFACKPSQNPGISFDLTNGMLHVIPKELEFLEDTHAEQVCDLFCEKGMHRDPASGKMLGTALSHARDGGLVAKNVESCS